MSLNMQDETWRLRAVVLGVAQQNGPVPEIKDAYDSKSIAHIQAGTYFEDKDMGAEMEAFLKGFEK